MIEILVHLTGCFDIHHQEGATRLQDSRDVLQHGPRLRLIVNHIEGSDQVIRCSLLDDAPKASRPRISVPQRRSSTSCLRRRNESVWAPYPPTAISASANCTGARAS